MDTRPFLQFFLTSLGTLFVQGKVGYKSSQKCCKQLGYEANRVTVRIETFPLTKPTQSLTKSAQERTTWARTCKIQNQAEFTTNTKNSNTHCTHVAKCTISVLFLVRFNNLPNYGLLLELHALNVPNFKLVTENLISLLKDNFTVSAGSWC